MGKLIKSWKGSFVNFLIRTEPAAYKVRRRFKDFTWLYLEELNGDSTKVEFPDPEVDDDFIAVFGHTGKILEKWREVASFENLVDQLLMMEALKYLHAQVTEVQKLFQTRDQEIKQHAKA